MLVMDIPPKTGGGGGKTKGSQISLRYAEVIVRPDHSLTVGCFWVEHWP